MRGKGDHAGKCAGLRGHSRENWGVMQNFSEIIKKPPPPPSPPPPIKNERSLKGLIAQAFEGSVKYVENTKITSSNNSSSILS